MDERTGPNPLIAERSSTEPDDPDCQVAGCERSGTVPRKMRRPNTEEPVTRHYVCRYHHRLFLAIRVGIVAVLLLVLVLVYFQL